MSNTLKKRIWILSRRTPFLYMFKLYRRLFQSAAFIKHRIIIDYARTNEISTFVETGTYLGDMIWDVKKFFKEIHSIEIDKDLVSAAKKRFSLSSNIYIYEGNSIEVLPLVLNKLSKPALFWLDAHYSGGITAMGSEKTPIVKELSHIFAHKVKGHVILIDDAYSFIGADGYPTIEELKQYVSEHFPKNIFEVKDEIIRIYNKVENHGQIS